MMTGGEFQMIFDSILRLPGDVAADYANETRRFPVVFVIDPKLPKDVNTITLSYTFFEVGGRTAEGNPADPAAARSPAAGGG